MGRADGPHEVSFNDENTWTVRKKVGYVLAFLAIAACIVVGLLVYYVGVMGIECNGGVPGVSDSLTGGKTKKPKVSKSKINPLT